MKYVKGQKLICIKDVVIIQGVGTTGAIWFEHSHHLGGNFDPEDFILNKTYEIY